MTLFQFDNVTRYSPGGKQAAVLSNVTFSHPEGVSIGVLGARGSGKSTLINLLIGAENPNRGRVTRNKRLSPPVATPSLLNRSLTGEENTIFLGRLFGVDTSSLCRFVRDFSGLGPSFQRSLKTYNSARHARLAFSLSYGLPADCYVADGALVGGDGPFRERCKDLVLTRKRQAALFFTTGSPMMMRLFADVGAVLHGGTLVFYPSVSAAIQAHITHQDASKVGDIEPVVEDDEEEEVGGFDV